MNNDPAFRHGQVSLHRYGKFETMRQWWFETIPGNWMDAIVLIRSAQPKVGLWQAKKAVDLFTDALGQ